MIFLIGWSSFFYNKITIYTPILVEKAILFKIAKEYLMKKNIWNLLNRFHVRAIVIESKTQIFASTDHCKSFSLFYSNNNFFISNKIDLIKEKKKNLVLEKDFSNELLFSGYMSGEKTIFTDIKQLRAGEALLYKKKSNKFKTNKYFNYLPDSKNNKTETELIKIHEEILNKEFLKIINENQNKLILVPLSGGLDSRLILSKLVELGHRKLLAFSYGPKNSFEVKTARKVSKMLSVKWLYINQNSNDYKNYFNSLRIIKFWKFGDFYSTLPNNQDLLAIHFLKSKKIVDKNCIIINGQTGDFISGGHIPNTLIGKKIKKENLVNEIINKHFSLLNCQTRNRTKLKSVILRTFNRIDKKVRDLASLYEYWEYEERQSKFIIGGQRVYDFYNLKWELPFWNFNYVDFWRNIPYELKLNQYLYKKYLTKYDYKGVFTKIKIKKQGWSFFQRVWIKPISIFCKYILGIKIQKKFISFAKYFDRFSFYYSAYGLREFIKYSKKIRNPNSLFVIKWVELINKEFK